MGDPVQLAKKVYTDFFGCASPAKHFAHGKMLLRSKSLEKSRLFCGGVLYCEAGFAPSRSPAALLIWTKAWFFDSLNRAALKWAARLNFRLTFYIYSRFPGGSVPVLLFFASGLENDQHQQHQIHRRYAQSGQAQQVGLGGQAHQHQYGGAEDDGKAAAGK